jgi:hypothetical protein
MKLERHRKHNFSPRVGGHRRELARSMDSSSVKRQMAAGLQDTGCEYAAILLECELNCNLAF